MQNALKSLENNALAALTQRAPQGIVNAIKTASAKTGVSFSYLMEKAAAESNFNPTVKAKTSSATGLFQFIESTWIDMIEKHGAKYGIDKNLDRDTLLNLRKDPQLASSMAAEFANDNKTYLEKVIGGDIGNTELYFAHFMGAGGAGAFLSQLKESPSTIGADLFPKAARANRNVFYDRSTGEPKTLQQIYDYFDRKFSDDSTKIVPETMAHKPETKSNSLFREGYQLKQIDESRYARINPTQMRAQNSLYQIQRQMDAFFGNPIGNTATDVFGGIPSGFYSKLTNPTAFLLNAIK